MNEPAIHRMLRLIAFQTATMTDAAKGEKSSRTVLPPATHRPAPIVRATSANNSRLGSESASTKTSQSPVALAAPAFRARAI
jgi:hypothetical protein